jgi:peptidoglycan/LPS O-acetylase OafA/YrhL
MIYTEANICYLSDIFNPKKNSFSFLRIFLAAMVVFSHSHPLGGFGSENFFGSSQENYGIFAVYNFFILSGFLITRSYINSPSFGYFLWNRVLRIFPGFWACLTIAVLFFAPIIYCTNHGNIVEYFQIKIDNPLSYIKENFFLEIKQYGIANLLKSTPYQTAFNGSLWTLIYEFKCYLLIGFIGSLGILRTGKKVIFYLFLFLWLIYVLDIGVPGAAKKIIPFFSDIYMLKLPMYFLAGSTYFLFMEKIVFKHKFFLVALGLTVISLQYNFYSLVAPLTLPYLLFSLAFKLPLTNFDKYGDFSYGLYIYAFPVQQMAAFFKLNTTGFTSYFIVTLSVSTIFAILSYHLVEKPFLKLKKYTFRSNH